MLEADRIPTFQIQDALVDLSDVGYDDVKANFSEGAWKDVSVGDGVYGAPVDGGPMGDDLPQGHLRQVRHHPADHLGRVRGRGAEGQGRRRPALRRLPGATCRPYVTALLYQNGAQPFTYDPANESEIGIKLNDDATKEVLDYWAGLVKKGLVGTQDQFTPEYISGVIGGNYATYVSAAWAPGYLSGAGVGEGEDAGKCAATAPLPQWDPANPVSVNWGGSAFAVTSQAKDPELAAKVAFGVYADDASLKDGWENQIIFPLNLNVLNDPDVRRRRGRVLRRPAGQQGGLRPGGQRLQGLDLQPVRPVLLRRVHEADRRDQRRVRRPVRGGRRPAGRCRRRTPTEQGFTVK